MARRTTIIPNGFLLTHTDPASGVEYEVYADMVKDEEDGTMVILSPEPLVMQNGDTLTFTVGPIEMMDS